MRKFFMFLMALLPMSAFAQFDAAPVVTARIIIGNVKGNSSEGATKACLDAIKANMSESLSGGRLVLTTDPADADYLINVNVIRESHTNSTFEYKGKKTVTYTTTVNYSYEVVNTSDNSVFKTFSREAKASDSNQDKARTDAENKCGRCSFLINELCPLRGNIIDVEKLDKKGRRVETLYINIGSMHMIGPKDRFKVCSTRMVAGRNVDKVIGHIEIKSVEGEDVSLCEVRKDKEGEAIKQALDAGESLTVVSEERRAGILSGGLGELFK